MEIVLNFSHALSPVARQQLEERIGPFIEVMQPCQIDFSQQLKPQVEQMVEEGCRKVGAVLGYNYASPHYIVPPALSYAAVLVGALMGYAQSDAVPPSPPPMIVLKREGAPPQYVLGEIIR